MVAVLKYLRHCHEEDEQASSGMFQSTGQNTPGFFVVRAIQQWKRFP